jgi:hypothetical protein
MSRARDGLREALPRAGGGRRRPRLLLVPGRRGRHRRVQRTAEVARPAMRAAGLGGVPRRAHVRAVARPFGRSPLGGRRHDRRRDPREADDPEHDREADEPQGRRSTLAWRSSSCCERASFWRIRAPTASPSSVIGTPSVANARPRLRCPTSANAMSGTIRPLGTSASASRWSGFRSTITVRSDQPTPKAVSSQSPYSGRQSRPGPVGVAPGRSVVTSARLAAGADSWAPDYASASTSPAHSSAQLAAAFIRSRRAAW